jgi:tetratricopeptide (TPR) repeat protein
LLLIGLRDWQMLEREAGKLLRVDPRCEMAWIGLAEALLRLGQPERAAAAAMRAIGLDFFLPDAHFILARSLVAQSMWVAALESMERLLGMQPENELARSYVRRLRRMIHGESGIRSFRAP